MKSNIGHLEAACGISQLTKVLFQFREKQLVPTIHAEPLNPDIDLEDSPFYLQTSLAEWQSSQYPRRALINSFGAVGTNANILVEEYIQPTRATMTEMNTLKPLLFLFSAKTPEALKIFIPRIIDFLNTNPNINLVDLAYTLQVGRESMSYGLAVKANHKDNLISLLKGYVEGALASTQTPQVIELSKFQEKSSADDDLTVENIELSLREQDLTQLAHAWIQGLEINWKQLYGNARPKRLVLPNYPFQHQSFWLKNDQDINPAHHSLQATKKVSPSNAGIEVERKGTENHLLDLLNNMLQLPREELDINKKLIEYGIDSLRSMRLLNRINHYYQLDLEADVLVHYSTISSLAERIVQEKSALEAPSQHASSLVNLSQQSDKFPPFIERKTLAVEPNDQLIQTKKDIEKEKLFTHFLEMGIGFYKIADKLIVEYAKGGISEEILKEIKETKNQLSTCLSEGKKYYPLSFSQKMMCIQTELYKNESYRLVLPYSLSTWLEPNLLEQALQIVSDRHEILRTVFSKINNTLVQVVHEKVKVDIEVLSYSGDLEENKQQISDLLKQQKLHHFDLKKGPLYELKLINMAQSQLIILDIHHAICDGVAASFFMNELMTNYKLLEQGNKAFPSSTTQYAHFVLEQFKINAKSESKELAWWQEKLKNAPLQCHIPYDYKSHSKLQIYGGVAYIRFSENERSDIREFCQENHISLTLFILSSLYVVLHLWTREDDIIIGSTLNQRNRLEYEDLIGDFINLIPLRLCLTTETTGRELLALVKSVFTEVSAHQKITFNKLAQKLRVKRNNANLPFYNVLLDSLNLAAFDKNEASPEFKFEL
ncbi:MAG: condensation domain-containing protein, partial [Proteobacteria bacterium]|nr:condensation domain-containing protein [Pseudomonadota bacterium]